MPDTAIRPDTPRDLAAAVAAARAAGHAVFPRGGGTQAHLGYAPTKPGVTLDTRGLNKLIDHPARDLTVTAEAGMTAAALAAVLRVEGQRLPVDIPNAADATLGGSVAANVSGPRRLACGTLRDYLLGVTVATDNGELASAGGRVVKNVAGYDLMKLHTGALGTLGVITQVTFKVTPIPEAQMLVAFGCTDADVAPTLDRLHASGSRPAVVELWSAEFARLAASAAGVELPHAAPWVVMCGFEEKAAAVTWQVATLLAELRAVGVTDMAELSGSTVWGVLPDLSALADRLFSVTVAVPPSRLAAAVRAARATGPELLVHAHALTGVLRAHWPQSRAGELTPERAAKLVAALTPAAPGTLAATHCPDDWKRSLPLWGAARGDLAVMRAVKKALDPDDVFNPGRLFG